MCTLLILMCTFFEGTNLSIDTKQIIKIPLPMDLSDSCRKSPDSWSHKVDMTCRDARLKSGKVGIPTNLYIFCLPFFLQFPLFILHPILLKFEVSPH